MRRDDDANRAVHARQFVDGGHVLDVTHSCAPILGRKHDTHEAHFSEFLNGRHGKLAGFIPLHDVRRNLSLGVFAHALLQLQLLVVQLEIQNSSESNAGMLQMWRRVITASLRAEPFIRTRQGELNETRIPTGWYEENSILRWRFRF